MKAEELDDFLNTNALKLDQEVNTFPENYRKVAVAVADARKQVDLAKIHVDIAKEELKTTDANLSLNIRNSPERYGLTKATEASIDATVLMQVAHKNAFVVLVNSRQDLAADEHKLGILEAALAAMDAKGKLALGKGVELHLANYRSAGPRMPSNPRRED